MTVGSPVFCDCHTAPRVNYGRIVVSCISCSCPCVPAPNTTTSLHRRRVRRIPRCPKHPRLPPQLETCAPDGQRQRLHIYIESCRKKLRKHASSALAAIPCVNRSLPHRSHGDTIAPSTARFPLYLRPSLPFSLGFRCMSIAAPAPTPLYRYLHHTLHEKGEKDLISGFWRFYASGTRRSRSNFSRAASAEADFKVTSRRLRALVPPSPISDRIRHLIALDKSHPNWKTKGCTGATTGTAKSTLNRSLWQPRNTISLYTNRAGSRATCSPRSRDRRHEQTASSQTIRYCRQSAPRTGARKNCPRSTPSPHRRRRRHRLRHLPRPSCH